MNIKKEIKNLIQKILKDLNIEEKVEISHPNFLEYGDFSFNAISLAKKNQKNPQDFAKKIKENLEEKIQEKNFSYIEKIEIANGGFLNFFLSKDFFLDFLKNDKKKIKKEKVKILIEHSSPNLFKPFHIGHLVNNSIGNFLVNICEVFYEKKNIKKIFFPSDVSPGIAKAVWALKEQKILPKNLDLEKISNAYVEGTKMYKENQKAKEQIDKINSQIYTFLNTKKIEEKNVIDLYKKGTKISLKHLKEITKKLGSKFDGKILESEAEILGKKIVLENIPEVFQKSDGAIIFEGKDFTNVFINSAGFGTYLAKDVGLLKIKSKKYKNFSKSFTITDIEQKAHFQMVEQACKKIPELKKFAEKSHFLQHGRMSFSGKEKISSRLGNVLLAKDVIQNLEEKFLEKMKDRDFSQKDKKKIAENLAISNLKYAILKITSGKNISFDMEKDLSFEGNTATFLNYSYVRALSILKKAEKKRKNFSQKKAKISDLEKKLYIFEEKVEESFWDFSAHHLANYLYEISKEFNNFYSQNKILDKKNPDFFYNIKILEKFCQNMEEGFKILGMEIVRKM